MLVHIYTNSGPMEQMQFFSTKLMYVYLIVYIYITSSHVKTFPLNTFSVNVFDK